MHGDNPLLKHLIDFMLQFAKLKNDKGPNQRKHQQWQRDDKQDALFHVQKQKHGIPSWTISGEFFIH